MKCPKCGKEIAENSQFCEFCGAEIKGKKLPSKNKNMKWLLLAAIGVVICVLALIMVHYASTDISDTNVIKQSDYVDLGLPSGTLWKNKNEPELYDWWKAKNTFDQNIPTGAQMDELLTYCKQEEVTENNIRKLKIIGPNGNSIIIVPMGYEARGEIIQYGKIIKREGETWGIGRIGFFMTSSIIGSGYDVGGMEIQDEGGLSAKYSTKYAYHYKCSVLLVKKNK